MLKFTNLFNKNRVSVIGMVHIAALPGTPLYQGSVQKLIDKACHETETLIQSGIDAVLIENMHDVPYIQSKKFGPETVAMMTRVSCEVRKIVPENVPCGVQILSCGNTEALAVAQACSFNFIRAEGFVFAHIGDEGYTESNAGNLLRYRKRIEADDVLIFTDIKKKHSSHAITSDVPLSETAKAAEYFLSNGLIVTGNATGDPTKVEDFQEVRRCTKLPVLIGSGVTFDNLHNYLECDGLIVGSYFKNDGKWFNDLNETKVKNFMQKLKELINHKNKKQLI